ncbi:uncharacterized protein L3040_003019 [Drepanopeziza brunnea f. sp. 'multigermtubi']|uniref:Uncharacterized protein n=1 Tax=Marssonina brunnea f. sp. multigermtubi (strain MB_m1) TaxID=1072389 RepID=K1W7X1_MARBU|nr:uncharacterized protein MBM_08658 [Drepanopeziza brunnea f. sp. 'multigermtubi' MB_m1]EKD13215.1 hypothetical protein MBM_08658 [Drepanopeziza brunnea f. sp. 'multigermtubi' MB_m1]KAJ5047177.1 hypothetical protein L3040_003019 [Drepanopeziza brunnea f. sp. 'multigermtubi']
MGSCTSRPLPPRFQRRPAKLSRARIRKSRISPSIFTTASQPEPIKPGCGSAPRSHSSSTSRSGSSAPSSNPTQSKTTTATTPLNDTQTQLQPPTPQKEGAPAAPALPVPPQAATGSPASTSTADLELRSVQPLLGTLMHAIRAYSFHRVQSQTQTLADLAAIISSLPPAVPPRTLEALRDLERDVARLYAAQKALFSQLFEPALSEAGSLWSEFLALDPEGRRRAARNLERGGVLMRIFDGLGKVRAGCEEVLARDAEVGRRFQALFEGVWEELREGEGEVGGGVVSACMRWLVLKIVEAKRREGLGERIEWVKKGRVEVSVALLAVVEGLREDD